MAYTTHFTRYSHVDAHWLPFWGQGAGQQLLASLAFCAGLLLPLSMMGFQVSVTTLVSVTCVIALMLYQLTRLACHQALQAMAVLRLAPASASERVLRRWRVHLCAVSLSLGGLNLGLLVWKAPQAPLVLWAATLLSIVITRAVQQTTRHHQRLGLLLGGITLLVGMPMISVEAAREAWMTPTLSVVCALILILTLWSLRQSSGHLRLRAQRTDPLEVEPTPWRARFLTWWRRWTFLAQPTPHSRGGINAGALIGVLPGTAAGFGFPLFGEVITMKHSVLLLVLCMAALPAVVIRDLHWRVWLRPNGQNVKRLGWRVLKDTLYFVTLLFIVPGLLWLLLCLLFDQTVPAQRLASIVYFVVVACTLAVWRIGANLTRPNRAHLEFLALTAVLGLAWVLSRTADFHWPLPTVTQALPLSLVLMAIALWRIDRVWQRADVYALAHRRPEPTGWNTD